MRAVYERDANLVSACCGVNAQEVVESISECRDIDKFHLAVLPIRCYTIVRCGPDRREKKGVPGGSRQKAGRIQGGPVKYGAAGPNQSELEPSQSWKPKSALVRTHPISGALITWGARYQRC